MATNAAVEAVTARFAGLPAWAWGIAAGGSVLAFQAWKRRSEPAPEPEPDPEAVADVPDLVTGGYSGALAMSPSPMGSGSWAVAPSVADYLDVAGSSSPGASITTRDGWRRVAIDWAISQNFNPIDVQNAVTKWLDGDPLTVAEVAIINALLREFGEPPGGAPSILRASTPEPVASATTGPAGSQRIKRWNGGPDGRGSFFAVIQHSNGWVTHIVDGNVYNGLRASIPEDVVSLADMQSILNNATGKSGAAPRWMPPGTTW